MFSEDSSLNSLVTMAKSQRARNKNKIAFSYSISFGRGVLFTSSQLWPQIPSAKSQK